MFDICLTRFVFCLIQNVLQFGCISKDFGKDFGRVCKQVQRFVHDLFTVEGLRRKKHLKKNVADQPTALRCIQALVRSHRINNIVTTMLRISNVDQLESATETMSAIK